MPKAKDHENTPWTQPSSLAALRASFYPRHVAHDPYAPPAPDKRRAAISTVSRWSLSTAGGRLPHAITATAHLTEAVLHDADEVHDADEGSRVVISDWARRAVYAMAFCRFVNGFVDRDVARSAKRALLSASSTAHDPSESAVAVVERERVRGGESSMYAHAAAIGMPEGFVDLRHRATHDEMPGIGELRSMVEKGLEWLWEVWWSGEVDGDVGVGEGGGAGEVGEERQAVDCQEVDEDLLARQTEAEAEVEDDVDDGLCVVCRKRKRGGGGEEAQEGDEGPQVMTYKERLLWNKRKRKRPKTAFGLFEMP